MRRATRLAVIGLAWAGACLGASAQNVYRCGNSYSQSACSGGQVIDTGPAQPAQTTKAPGTSAVERDLKAAAILEKDRLQLQANAAPAYIPAAAREPARAPNTAKGPGKPRKPDQFTAVAPGKSGKDKKDKKEQSAKKSAAKGGKKKDKAAKG